MKLTDPYYCSTCKQTVTYPHRVCEQPVTSGITRIKPHTAASRAQPVDTEISISRTGKVTPVTVTRITQPAKPVMRVTQSIKPVMRVTRKHCDTCTCERDSRTPAERQKAYRERKSNGQDA